MEEEETSVKFAVMANDGDWTRPDNARKLSSVAEEVVLAVQAVYDSLGNVFGEGEKPVKPTGEVCSRTFRVSCVPW